MTRTERHFKKVGIAFSGGADSTALAYLMSELGRSVAAKIKDFPTADEIILLHVNHGDDCGEGKEAVDCARSIALKLGLNFVSADVEVRSGGGSSIEMSAREARLSQLADWTRKLHLDAVFMAHQRDDIAETLLLRLCRGAGARGLSGLRRESEIDGMRIVRPLLGMTHNELCEILINAGVEWREDPSNDDLSIKRNLVRREIIPYLERILDPHIRMHLAQSAEILGEEDAKSELAMKRRFAHEKLVTEGKASGFKEVEKFVVTMDRAVGFKPDSENKVAYLSAKVLSGRQIEFRLWREGDRISPVGMTGSKKLQDVFTAAKIPPAIRRKIPILVDSATQEVLWVSGYRIAKKVAVENSAAESIKISFEQL